MDLKYAFLAFDPKNHRDWGIFAVSIMMLIVWPLYIQTQMPFTYLKKIKEVEGRIVNAQFTYSGTDRMMRRKQYFTFTINGIVFRYFDSDRQYSSVNHAVMNGKTAKVKYAGHHGTDRRLKVIRDIEVDGKSILILDENGKQELLTLAIFIVLGIYSLSYQIVFWKYWISDRNKKRRKRKKSVA